MSNSNSDDVAVVAAAAPFVTNVQQAYEEDRRAWAIAQRLSKSGLLKSRGIHGEGDAFLVLFTSHEAGYPYSVALQHFWVDKGKVNIPPSAAIAKVQQLADCEYFRVYCEGEGDDAVGVVESKRRSRSEANPRRTFSMDDARVAQLTGKDNWKKYPRRMLQWRAVGESVAIDWPEAVHGLVVGGDDKAEVVDVTPSMPQPSAGPDPLLTGGTPAKAPDSARKVHLAAERPAEGSTTQSNPGRDLEAAREPAAASFPSDRDPEPPKRKKTKRKKTASKPVEVEEPPPTPQWEVESVLTALAEAGFDDPPRDIIEAWDNDQRDKAMTWAAQVSLGEAPGEPEFWEELGGEPAEEILTLTPEAVSELRAALQKRSRQFNELLGSDTDYYDLLLESTLRKLDVPALAEIPSEDFERAMTLAANARPNN